MKLCLKCGHKFHSVDWMCPNCGFTPSQVNGHYIFAPKSQHYSSGFKPEYFPKLFMHESTNFWFKARNKFILWSIKSFSSLDQGLYLEVGCGTGYVLSAISTSLSRLTIFGSEIFVAALSHAKKRASRAYLFQADARKIPFVGHFDSLGAFDVLEHITDDVLVLRQMHTALRHNGILFLTVPQHPWLWSKSDEYSCHCRRYTASDLHNKLISVGFDIQLSTSFVSLLLPLMIFNRLSGTSKDSSPMNEFMLPVWLNEILFMVMSFELLLIQFGVRFPCGGSRLVVARKI